jgi:hypothetical protein
MPPITIETFIGPLPFAGPGHDRHPHQLSLRVVDAGGYRWEAATHVLAAAMIGIAQEILERSRNVRIVDGDVVVTLDSDAQALKARDLYASRRVCLRVQTALVAIEGP